MNLVEQIADFSNSANRIAYSSLKFLSSRPLNSAIFHVEQISTALHVRHTLALMATSTPRLGAPYDPITSPHLRSAMFEKLDKDRFVEAYIQSQKQLTTRYAADGKALVSSWDHQTLGTPTKQKQPTHLSNQYGFDTPVLKARVANPPDASVTVEDRTLDVDRHESEPVRKVKSKKPSIPSIKPKKFSSKSKKENMPPESKSRKTKPASKKRPLTTDSDDDEHTAREPRFL